MSKVVVVVCGLSSLSINRMASKTCRWCKLLSNMRKKTGGALARRAREWTRLTAVPQYPCTPPRGLDATTCLVRLHSTRYRYYVPKKLEPEKTPQAPPRRESRNVA